MFIRINLNRVIIFVSKVGFVGSICDKTFFGTSVVAGLFQERSGVVLTAVAITESVSGAVHPM